ncbi:WecB/TagA/CpsF family glycosyltransferase [Vibrio lentus]|uniref:Glycosyl transferase n=1 Tax=Vibrio lentus TaxID=136468 RepID=A0A2N7IJP1_9VIBR|nr:WecB/TagA/CpsF family glycosyltransferase [Vibrio lentus]PML57939.1 hypothetical protein BCT74_18760 [Vibrio lentus]PMM25317.1 hypothetical protein BCT58_10080 [Vibrio lentus]
MISVIKRKITDDVLKSEFAVNIFLNPYSYLLMRRQKAVIEEVDNIYIDGEWLCKFLRWFGIADVKRCSFDNTSLAPMIFGSLDSSSPIAIVGSDQDSNNRFCSLLEEEYPKISVAYKRNGYFSNELELMASIENIIESGATKLICGMGSPLQEKFLITLRERGWKGTSFTCGGFIHQTATKGKNYYPEWIDRMNIRFIYRMYDEPKLIKRYSCDYVFFIFLFLKDFIGKVCSYESNN